MITMEELFRIAGERGASDIHLSVDCPPILRVNGSLIPLNEEKLTPDVLEKISLSLMDKEQQLVFKELGELDFSYSIPSLGRYRLNAFRQRGSVALVVRLVPFTIPTMEKLGLPLVCQELANLQKGLVLVTGPTGSGKSTTLAAMLDYINKNRSCHIVTIEDPIEYLHRRQKSIVNQREVGQDTHSFANALRSALRQDPDVILVGEMRDLETISTAITAAETGHLVFSTLHTNDATQAIDRIIDVFPPHQQQQIRVQLAAVLQGVLAQQLLPRVDSKERVAAIEVLIATSAVRNLIREGKTHQIPNIIQTNARLGMQSMNNVLQDLVRQGIINPLDVQDRS